MSEKILHRDSLNTPWGFRMTGGKDLKQSLSIQQIKPGSPCHGELEVGDVIVEIQRHDAANLTHKQAQDLIRNSGGSLKLRIIRQGFSHTRNSSNSSSSKGTFLLQKLHNSLTDAVIGKGPTSPRAFSPTINFNSPLTPNYYDYPEEKKSTSWGMIQMKPKPVTPRKQPEFGWMPEALKQRTHRYIDEHPTQKTAVTTTSYYTPLENKFTSIPEFPPSKYIRCFSPPKFQDNYSRIRQVSSPPQMADNYTNSNILHDFNHNLQSLPETNHGFNASPHNARAYDEESRDINAHDDKSLEETISEIATHRPTFSEPEPIKITDF